jgi:thiamine kinase-like enzyme
VLIDYEFAGMGNVFFDIASVCGLWDHDSQRDFLQIYFGYSEDRHLLYTRFYTVVQLFWNAAWGYVKTCTDISPLIDYKSWADEQLSLAIDT